MKLQDEHNVPERQLVQKAAVSAAARERLRAELLPYVTRATREFMRSRNIPERREAELIGVGMEPFNRVFNIYLKNAGDCYEDEGHFYQYYIWWMRQAIVAYLKFL